MVESSPICWPNRFWMFPLNRLRGQSQIYSSVSFLAYCLKRLYEFLREFMDILICSLQVPYFHILQFRQRQTLHEDCFICQSLGEACLEAEDTCGLNLALQLPLNGRDRGTGCRRAGHDDTVWNLSVGI